MRPALVLVPMLASVVGTGCASTGAVPRPFPGAPVVVKPGAGTPAGAPAPTPSAVPPTPSVTSPTPLVATALALRGTPYRYGGSDPSGFDCSGLVQWVFRHHGVNLPRETQDQFRSGEMIDADDLQPGDLVFFETEGSGASHVGIALDGESFVHAPNSRGVVRVERLAVDYWSKRYLGARRVP
jgi:peptidoglycan endopeptidase LytE